MNLVDKITFGLIITIHIYLSEYSTFFLD